MIDKKVSIITVCFNSEKTIRETIESVINQTYSNIEYVIIDGSSTDNTLNIINEYKNKISKIISEKDLGIYFAMNKGILHSTGDIIGFLNSDDIFSSNNIIEEILANFNMKNIDIVYGDLIYVKKEDPKTAIRYWLSSKYDKNSLLKGWMPAHPTFYVKKDLYNKYGSFNTKYKISADYDLMIRFLKNSTPCHVLYIPKILIYMRTGGESNRSLQSIIKANIESMQSLKENGFRLFFIIGVLKPIRKIFQFFRSKKLQIKD